MKWISVEDELPEEGVGVLVVTPWGSVVFAVRDNICYEIADVEVDSPQIEVGLIELEDEKSITHWMPLPEAPKDKVQFLPEIGPKVT